jgi:capsular polysaccharide biosynthesis protein
MSKLRTSLPLLRHSQERSGPIQSTNRYRSLLRGALNRVWPSRETMLRIAVERMHVPASRLGYRWVQRESLREHMQRRGRAQDLHVVHPSQTHAGLLPRNVGSREILPDVRGWWGFSFRDVPQRGCAETLLGTIEHARAVHYRESADHVFAGDYYVGLLTADGWSLELREVRFREKHASTLRSRPRVERFQDAAWVMERVYHNHSHWLTAHLPKFLLLRELDRLGGVLLPAELPRGAAASLRLAGIDPAGFRRYDEAAVQRIDRMTVISSDRFRPELVQSVRSALAPPGAVKATRRVYISRSRAARRALRNEQAVWAELRRHGFERVFMEDLEFARQVELMAETAILVAPHGAGLTNMMFCAPGTAVVEIANLDFPNPNFYALACALGLEYWLVPGRAHGDGHPLFRDVSGDVDELRRILPALLEGAPRTAGQPA